MNYISVIEPPSREAIAAFVEKRTLSGYLEESYQHPQEDYLLASQEPPVFVVADGVTLDYKKLAEAGKTYPNPSPAGAVARIFCESIQQNAAARYADFHESDIAPLFAEGIHAVAAYNTDVGPSDISGNPTGLYAATGSFMILKDGKAYWASICDAFFAHFDAAMNLKYMSSGVCSPYAVINGEKRMLEHIEHGVNSLEKDDRLFVFTDGFEHYIKNPEFTELFKNWSDDLADRSKTFSENMNRKDPEKYGHERSIIAIVV